MTRDELMDWMIIAALASVSLLVVMLVVGASYKSGEKYGRVKAEAERKARIEYRCWCEEWADVRATQEAYLRERRAK